MGDVHKGLMGGCVVGAVRSSSSSSEFGVGSTEFGVRNSQLQSALHQPIDLSTHYGRENENRRKNGTQKSVSGWPAVLLAFAGGPAPGCRRAQWLTASRSGSTDRLHSSVRHNPPRRGPADRRYSTLCRHDGLSSPGLLPALLVEVDLTSAPRPRVCASRPPRTGMEILTSRESPARPRDDSRVVACGSSCELPCRGGRNVLRDAERRRPVGRHGLALSERAGPEGPIIPAPSFPSAARHAFLRPVQIRACGELRTPRHRPSRAADSGQGSRLRSDDPWGGPICVSCGECSSVRSRGALGPEAPRGDRRPPAASGRPSTPSVPSAGSGAALTVQVRNNSIIRVTSPRQALPNRGRLCVKGRFGLEYAGHPDHLTVPLIRKGTAKGKRRADPLSGSVVGRGARPRGAALFRLKETGRSGPGGPLVGQVLERSQLSLPEVRPDGLWDEQRRPLRPSLPRHVGRGDGRLRWETALRRTLMDDILSSDFLFRRGIRTRRRPIPSLPPSFTRRSPAAPRSPSWTRGGRNWRGSRSTSFARGPERTRRCLAASPPSSWNGTFTTSASSRNKPKESRRSRRFLRGVTPEVTGAGDRRSRGRRRGSRRVPRPRPAAVVLLGEWGSHSTAMGR